MLMKISHAHMHGTMHVPTLNEQLKATLDQVNYPGIKMIRLDNGDLACEFKDKKFILPSVNFKNLVVDQSAEPEKKNDKKAS
jgi:hypothetical protein